jgi:hypothetical protein
MRRPNLSSKAPTFISEKQKQRDEQERIQRPGVFDNIIRVLPARGRASGKLSELRFVPFLICEIRFEKFGMGWPDLS